MRKTRSGRCPKAPLIPEHLAPHRKRSSGGWASVPFLGCPAKNKQMPTSNWGPAKKADTASFFFFCCFDGGALLQLLLLDLTSGLQDCCWWLLNCQVPKPRTVWETKAHFGGDLLFLTSRGFVRYLRAKSRECSWHVLPSATNKQISPSTSFSEGLNTGVVRPL